MVIKCSCGGESAFGDRPAFSISKFIAAVNSDVGNGYFWFEIRDVKHADQCSSISTRVWSHQMTSDLKICLHFWKCLQWSCLVGSGEEKNLFQNIRKRRGIGIVQRGSALSGASEDRRLKKSLRRQNVSQQSQLPVFVWCSKTNDRV